MSLEIKICGLKSAEAMAAALDCGARMSASSSFRKARAMSIRPRRPAAAGGARRAKAVAVTVDAGDDALDRHRRAMSNPTCCSCTAARPRTASLAVKARYGLTVIKALAVREAADLAAAEHYRGIADRLLFDAKPPAGAELPGGNGFPSTGGCWPASTATSTICFRAASTPPMSADALRIAKPPAIDVSSGVESAPGVKESGADRGILPGRRGPRPRNSRPETAPDRGERPMNKPVEPNSFRTGPDEQGMFGIFGGRFVAETLMPLILELERHWTRPRRSGISRPSSTVSPSTTPAGRARSISPSG